MLAGVLCAPAVVARALTPVCGPEGVYQTAEMMSRIRVARAEQAYAATLGAAEEMVRSAIALADAVGEHGAVRAEDAKALERLRKLAKRVRGNLGGSGEPQLAEPPGSARDAAAELGARAREFRDELEKCSRYEVSWRLVTLAGDVMLLSDVLKAFGVRE
jgi:hypothetical protein